MVHYGGSTRGNFSGMIELLAAVFFFCCFALLQPEVEYTNNYGKCLSKRCLLRSKKLVLFPPWFTLAPETRSQNT